MLWQVGWSLSASPGEVAVETAEHGRSQKRGQCGGMSQNEGVIASGSVLTFLAVEMLQILLMLYHIQTLFQTTLFCVETIKLGSLTQPVISATQVYGWL
jgi:hypothetical protein